jgi:hypothetical protein
MLSAELFLPPVLGDGGTYATLGKMRTLAQSGARNPLVRATAARLVELTEPNGILHAKLIRSWLEDHIIFLRDISTAEALYHPADLVLAIQRDGQVQCDCEDVAMLAAALGMSIGLRARYVVLAFRPGGPFQHVYADLSDINGRLWIDCDITRPSQLFDSIHPTRSVKVEV